MSTRVEQTVGRYIPEPDNETDSNQAPESTVRLTSFDGLPKFF